MRVHPTDKEKEPTLVQESSDSDEEEKQKQPRHEVVRENTSNGDLQRWEQDALEQVKTNCLEFLEELRWRKKFDPKGIQTMRTFRRGSMVGEHEEFSL